MTRVLSDQLKQLVFARVPVLLLRSSRLPYNPCEPLVVSACV